MSFIKHNFWIQIMHSSEIHSLYGLFVVTSYIFQYFYDDTLVRNRVCKHFLIVRNLSNVTKIEHMLILLIVGQRILKTVVGVFCMHAVIPCTTPFHQFRHYSVYHYQLITTGIGNFVYNILINVGVILYHHLIYI